MLETIRDLMNTSCIVPDWLHDIFLGYDDPGAAHYTRYWLERHFQTISVSISIYYCAVACEYSRDRN